MKKNWPTIGLLITLASFSSVFIYNSIKNTVFTKTQFELNVSNSADFDKKVFTDSINFANKSKTSFLTKPGIIIIPHHLTGAHIAADLIHASSKHNYLKIVLIGPNHYEKGDDKFITNNTPINQNIIDSDHSIGNPMVLINYYFPEAIIEKYLVKQEANLINIEDWTKILLNKNEPQNTLFIFSIDFSHYLTASDATNRDTRTIALIEKQSISEILKLSNEYTDSPSGLALMLSLAKELRLNNFLQIHHTNSGLLYSNYSSPVTSYFGLAYFPD